MSRFVLADNWVLEKLCVDIDAPEIIDLNQYRGAGILPDEIELPSDPAQNGPKFNEKDMESLLNMGFSEIRALMKTNHTGAESAMAWLCEHYEDPDIDAPLEYASADSDIKFNKEYLRSLMDMGFPEIRCKRALIRTNHKGTEEAMSWLFAHMDDADIDINGKDSQFSEADIAAITDMGFTVPQAKKALKETDDMQQAVEWLFSHPNDPGLQDTTDPAEISYDTLPAKYELFAFISHRGTSAHCGHYVAYVKKANVGWVLFNDNKVVLVPDIKKYVNEGYIYVYRRL